MRSSLICLHDEVVLYGIIVILVCMASWREKISELIRWEMKGVPILYPVTFIIFLIPILFWNIKNILSFDAFTIDDTSARYLLSALVQSLAAIIAIVVTLTLVAVQLSASAYSPRVIDIFKKDWIMWLLLVWYGLSIFFGLFVLEMIGGEYQNLGRWGVPLELCVFLAYLMGIIAFAGLFLHIGNVINLLKPETIIKRLSGNITKENVLKHIESVKENKKDRTKPIEEDPIQPIIDIIHSSVMKYDFATTSSGINTITNRAIEVMDPNERKISKHFYNHLGHIGKLAVNRGDEESVIKVIKNLEAFGELAAKREYDVTTAEVAKCMGSVGKTAAGKRYADATRQAILCIRSVGETASKGNSLKVAVCQVVRSIGAVGLSAEENELIDEVWQAKRSLVLVGIFAEGKRFEKATQKALECLARLDTSSKEIVESEIKTTLEEEDWDFFDGFMKSYKQYKLDEKLQSEKSE